MTQLTATYSPEDNKLRLYPVTRLATETYERVRTAGFKWAPRQELFVAPAWTPTREDLLLELCGEIGDEDRSLVERAEERAERFSEYQQNRSQDAEQARAAVAAIADNIPFGQPILIGHHSEKQARRDAERIQNGMRRAVRMWETSQYWLERAQAATCHARYKERPEVRTRRIRKIEADRHRAERTLRDAEKSLGLWSKIEDSSTALAEAKAIANLDHVSGSFPLATYPRDPPASQYEGTMSLWSALEEGIIDAPRAATLATRLHERRITWAQRWMSHYDNRLTYERAMLTADGGIETDRKGPDVGGGCRCWASRRGGCSYIRKVNRVTVTVEDNWGNGGANFTRTIPFDKLNQVMSAAEVSAARADGRLTDTDDKTGFYLRERPANEASQESTASDTRGAS
jgi:hypothetical protein